MFVREKSARGHTYLYLVENEREGGRVRRRIIRALSRKEVEDGVGAIALDIEELPPVPDRHASERRETLLFEETGTNAAMVFTGVKGDADGAFRGADYVRRERFAV